MRLFKESLQPHAPVIVEHKSELNFRVFKHHVALLSLPRLCGTTRETIPMMPGFLRRPVQIPDQFIGFSVNHLLLHIGLVWASGADNKDMYADKSMDPEPLMRLFDAWREERLVVFTLFRLALMHLSWILGVNNVELLIIQTIFMIFTTRRVSLVNWIW